MNASPKILHGANATMIAILLYAHTELATMKSDLAVVKTDVAAIKNVTHLAVTELEPTHLATSPVNLSNAFQLAARPALNHEQ